MVQVPKGKEWPQPKQMQRILAKLVDANGRILEPPNPSFQLIENGTPICDFSFEQIIDRALMQIARERDPQTLDAVERHD